MTNIILIGAPKCGTTYLANLFEKSDKYSILRGLNNFIECGTDIFLKNYNKDSNNIFCKTPGWIFKKNDLKNIIFKIKENKFNNLILLNIREFNEALESFYKMRKREGLTLKYFKNILNMNFNEFKKTKSTENPNLTYQECFESIEINLLYLINEINKIPNCSLRIIENDYLLQNNILDDFKNIGINLNLSNEIGNNIYLKQNLKYPKDEDLYQKYLNLKNNNIIKEYFI